jgi:hypothetical protein
MGIAFRYGSRKRKEIDVLTFLILDLPTGEILVIDSTLSGVFGE